MTTGQPPVLRPRPAPRLPSPWSFPRVERTELDNGITVLSVRLPGRAITAVELLVDAPLVVEPRQREGIASLTASALREGTRLLSAEELAAELARQGASLSTHAGARGWQVLVEAAQWRIGAALEVAAQALLEPVFPEREVARLVQQRLDQIRQQHADPSWLCAAQTSAVRYAAEERSARPAGGSAETVASITRDDVVAFHQLQARPSGLVVVVAGDHEHGAAVDLVAAGLSGWAQAGPPRSAPVPRLDGDYAGRVVVVDRPGSVQSELRWTRAGLSRAHPGWAAHQLAGYCLGGGLTQRLSMALREDKGYTYGISAQTVSHVPGGDALVSTSVETSVTGPAVAEARRVMAALASEGPTPDEVKVAADYLCGVAPMRTETSASMARQVAATAEEELGDDYLTRSFEALRGVAVDEVVAAARVWEPADFLLVAVGDAEQVVPQLAELGLVPEVKTAVS